MSDGLTARQTQVLKTLIDEYIKTAGPVGSEALDKKYGLGISPATIRNEMVALTSAGYLRQPHTSAGRVPTPQAMKFYIDQLMEERQMGLVDEVKAKEEVWDVRDDLDELMKEVASSLSLRTKLLSVAALKEDEEEKFWPAGHSYVFQNPDFFDFDVCAKLFLMLEQVDKMNRLFFEISQPSSALDVLFGEEIGWPELMPLGIVATHFKVKGKQGALGVIGPASLSYQTVIPTLRYFKKMIEEVAGK
ncbi:hypothetical protein ACFL1Q_02280 [Patescibacteria group bacterium]